MKDMMLSSPTLAFIVGTRALIAAGAVLMVASRLGAIRRRRLGLACVAAGAATTLPALLAVRRGSYPPGAEVDIGASHYARCGTLKYSRSWEPFALGCASFDLWCEAPDLGCERF